MKHLEFLVLTLTVCFLIDIAYAAQDKPNILFILADDLGYGDLASYPNPNTTRMRLQTPHVDALRAESMMFTEAYAGSTVCAPSRCALMTGRHSGHCTVRMNGPYLNASDVTVAKVLHDAGYYTSLIGKWGLGTNGTIASPNAKGFDHFFGYISQENAHNYYPPFLWRNDKQIKYTENEHASNSSCGYPRTTNCTWAEDALVNETISIFNEMSKKDSNFYMFLSFTTPHAGAIGSDSETGVPGPYKLSQYDSQDWPEVEKYFASVVTMQDAHVGKVLKALEDSKLSDNTVIFFASDNGAHNEGGHSYQFFESSGPLRGYKRSLHEGGVRSPLLVKWPGVTKPNTLSKQQWAFWDFLQTAADIAGVKESRLPLRLDGYSLVPTLRGEQQDQPKYIYHEFCHPNEDHKGYAQAVRFQDWKALRYDGDNSKTELYDLSKDIGETKDVSASNPDVVKMAQQFIDEAHVDGEDCIKTSSVGRGSGVDATLPDTLPMMTIVEAKRHQHQL